MRYKLEDLRFNPNPPPMKGGREFSLGPRQAFLKVEDILSHFALGRITLAHAIQALNYAKNAIIPNQDYPEEEKQALIKLYEEAVRKLRELATPERVKQWLLSHGPPRAAGVSLELFMQPQPTKPAQEESKTSSE